MRLAIAALSALVLGTGCASAPETESAAAAQPEASGPSTEADKGEKLICRRVNDLGSKRPRKVCATADEWANQR